MRYKRNEYFRFEFELPIDATVKIIEIDGKETPAKLVKAKIKNISPHGMKLLSDLDVHLDTHKKIKAEIQVFLNEDPFSVTGNFAWQKKELHGYGYGVEIVSNKESEAMVIAELKKFSKGTAYLKKE